MTADDNGTLNVPKWLQGVFTALVLGGISQGVFMYSSSQVTNQRLEATVHQLDKIETRMERLEERLQQGTADRWTRTDQADYAASNAARVEAISAELRAHKGEHAHPGASRDILNLRERVDRLERKAEGR